MNTPAAEDNSNWLLDFTLLDEIPVPGGHLPSLEPPFHWPDNSFSDSTHPPRMEFGDSFGNSDCIKEPGSKKRLNSGSCSTTASKACREKKRRDKLNDRFQELNAILEPGRSTKMDKTVILSDAVRMVTQLRGEASKLKESSEELQEKINELKAEKNELRDEKQKLKAEKERLEQQLKVFSTPPAAFLPAPPPAMPSPFSHPGQFVGNKFMPFMGYPAGVPMWQFTPSAAVDTSQDHVLRPPVA